MRKKYFLFIVAMGMLLSGVHAQELDA